MSKNIYNTKYILQLNYWTWKKLNVDKFIIVWISCNCYDWTNKSGIRQCHLNAVYVNRQARVFRQRSLCPEVFLCDSSYSVRCHIWASSRCIRQTNMCPTPRWNHVVMQLSSIASCNHIRSLFNNNLMLNVWDRLPALFIVLHSGKKQLNWRLHYWIFAQQNKLESYFWWKLSIHLAQEK